MKIIKSIKANETSTLKQIKKYNTKLCIRTKYENHIIEKTQISHLKSESNYCTIFLRNGKSIMCSKTLKEINVRISHPSFTKVHSSYVVNMDAVISLDAPLTEMILEDGNSVPISRGRKGELKILMNEIYD